MISIPIYRAKRKNDTDYIEIRLNQFFSGDTMCIPEIDITTLAIHFPDMIDSEGTKIFASLSEDGKGGDKLLEDKFFKVEFVSIQAKRIYLKRITGDSFLNAPKYLDCYRKKDLKVTGIQE